MELTFDGKRIFALKDDSVLGLISRPRRQAQGFKEANSAAEVKHNVLRCNLVAALHLMAHQKVIKNWATKIITASNKEWPLRFDQRDMK